MTAVGRRHVSDIWLARVCHGRAHVYRDVGDRGRERAALEMALNCAETDERCDPAHLDSIRTVLENWSDDSDSLRAN